MALLLQSLDSHSDVAPENRKSAQRDWQTFFFDQATSLHESPFGRRGDEVSFTKGKFIQRNPGSLDLDLFLAAAQTNDCAPQRFGANQDQLYCVKHLSRGFAIGWLVHVHSHIGAVKRNDGRFFPRANQRQEMDSDLAKVNVQQPSVSLP